MEREPLEDAPAQSRRSSRKRKTPDDYSAVQAVEEYERSVKRRRVGGLAGEDDEAAAAEAAEVLDALDSPSEDDVEAPQVDDPPLNDPPEVIPARPRKKKAAPKSPWREELEHVEMGEFKGASDPEEVRTSFFCVFVTFLCPVEVVCECCVQFLCVLHTSMIGVCFLTALVAQIMLFCPKELPFDLMTLFRFFFFLSALSCAWPYSPET
jgi:hypothetical protein